MEFREERGVRNRKIQMICGKKILIIKKIQLSLRLTNKAKEYGTIHQPVYGYRL